MPDLPTQATISWVSAWGDYDNDGYVDLVVANGADSGSQKLDLYRNRGDATFEHMTADQVGALVSDAAPWFSISWLDVNNDGFLDVVGTTQMSGSAQVPRLFLNQGDGSFHSVPAGALTATRGHYAAAPPADFNGDGLVDIMLGVFNYAGNATQNQLFLNRGDATLFRVSEGAFETDRFGANGISWIDYDNDGDIDLFIANYLDNNALHRDRLYQNDGHGRFTSITNTPLVQTSGSTYHGAWGDLDNDGHFDIVLEKVVGSPLVFFNEGGSFSRPPVSLPYPGGAPICLDYDNDGYLDLLITRGQGTARTNTLLRNLGQGTFEPVTDLISSEAFKRQGEAVGDFDNNGFMDLFEGSPIGKTALYRNLGNTHSWLKLRLKGTASNADGIGARVLVRATVFGKSLAQIQMVGGGSSLQAPDLRPNFGHGDATAAEEVRIEWPSGNVQTLTNVAANQILKVTEPTFFEPPRPVVTLNGSVDVTHSVASSARQWYFEGTPLDGATSRILSLTNAQAGQSGRYTIVAQTANGPRTNHVYLKVDTQFSKIEDGEIVAEVSITDTGTWFDYDNDGRIDVYVPHDVGQPDSLFHNDGDGKFSKVLGNPAIDVAVSSLAAAPGDFDNDGDVDLCIPHFDSAPEDLLRNDGKGIFARLADPTFNLVAGHAMDAAWADYDGDGDLDLLVARGADGQNDNDALYRNNGDGSFTALTAAEVGPLVNDLAMTYSCVWIDYDADGHPDAVMQHADGRILLHHNNGDGTFTVGQPGSLAGIQGNWASAWGDYDNDGFLDLLIGRGSRGGLALHRNLGGLTFTNVLSAARIRFSGDYCFAAWGDYDNDGFLDVLLAGYESNSVLYRNRGDGTFQSVNAGNLLSDGQLRSGVWVDYDNNGFLDLFMGCGDWVNQRNQLFRNNGNGNHWLKVKTVGTVSNRDGIGAKVRVKATIGGHTFTQLREISGNSGYHGLPLLAHFGLGDATNAATVRIEWPSGMVQELTKVAANQALTVTEPAPIRLICVLVPEGLRLECRGAANTTYEIRTSTDLKAWNALMTMTTDAAGLAVVSASNEVGVRFYRAVKK